MIFPMGCIFYVGMHPTIGLLTVPAIVLPVDDDGPAGAFDDLGSTFLQDPPPSMAPPQIRHPLSPST